MSPQESSGADRAEPAAPAAPDSGSLNSPRRPSSPARSRIDIEAEATQDRAWVRAVLADDGEASRQAFNELYHHHRERIFSVSLRVLRDREAALDATQETFLKVLRGLERFDPAGCFRAWVYRIAMNQAIDHYRYRKRRPAQSYADEYDSAREASSSTPFEAPTVPVERAEVRERIEAALEHLSEAHRTVFLLYSQEGLQYDEIAEIVQIPIGTVMSRLFNARRRLAEQLPAEWDPGGRRRRERSASAPSTGESTHHDTSEERA